MHTRFYTHYQVKCVIDDPSIKNGFYGAPTAVGAFCQKDFAFSVPDNYICRAFLALGYREGPYPQAKPRREGRAKIVGG